VVATTEPTPAPRAFRRAVADLTAAGWRPELSVEPIPAPQRIAPFAAAVTADVVVAGDEVGSGRLVLLHDPAGNAAWEGTFRCVTFARAEVEVRASWTPLLEDGTGLPPHLAAWAELLCTTAGLPPLPAGVVLMPSRRNPPSRSRRR
jgi:hypothetical protein